MKLFRLLIEVNEAGRFNRIGQRDLCSRHAVATRNDAGYPALTMGRGVQYPFCLIAACENRARVPEGKLTLSDCTREHHPILRDRGRVFTARQQAVAALDLSIAQVRKRQ